MASRMKEDERNERAIRNLLKLPENRRCINCNSLGPQYVCTSFWTFVCTTCSGIHREFTHRVKSVSMAKFTSQEVSALQGGGNASAKEIYFKEWDPQRQSFPDSSNVERLRDFIKHIYVDKRYTGEKSFDKPPRVKMGESEDSYQGGSRSPPFENERRYTERPSPGGRSDDRSLKNSYEETRSPGYDQDFRRSPVTARTDNIVNDWRREDRFGDGRRSEGRSPDHQRDPVMSSPPIVRPVRDILGEKAPPLRVIEPPKANGSRPSDGTIRTQRTASSSSLASSNGNPAELKTESSLIDFDTVPEPPSTTPPPQAQQSAPSPAPFATQPTTISNNNWANFDSVQEVKASNPPSNTNLLDVLSELSVPATQLSPSGTTAPVAAPISHPGGSQAATSLPSFNQWQNVHSQQNLLPAQSFNQAVGGSLNNQPRDPSLTGNTQVLSSSQVTHGVDVQPTAKKELPADLFTSNYSSFAAPGQGWYPAPQYGMGFNMQYNVPVFMPPAFQQPSKSSNPFDVNQSSPVQATTFPSMAPLQGALPNMVPPLGIQRTSSLGASLPAWNTNQSSHPLPSNIHRTSSLGTFPPTWMPPQGPSYGSGISSGPFMGQAPPNMPPPPRPQVGGFGSFNPSQQQSGLYYAPSSASHSFSSVGGNPFG